MKHKSSLIILFILGATWATFAIFTRFAALGLPSYGVAFFRLAIGSIMLYSFSLIKKKQVFKLENIKHYAIIGFFNSALPFTLFAFSAKYLDTGVVAILDGTVPMFELLLAVVFLKHRANFQSICGIIFGLLGIFTVSANPDLSLNISKDQIIPVLAAIIATISYASAVLYLDNKVGEIDPLVSATGSNILGCLVLLPSLFFIDYNVLANPQTLIGILGLGIFCTGFVSYLYFGLVAKEGSRIAVSCILLIPVFGTIYGAIFLSEPIGLNKIIGSVMILISMKFSLNLSIGDFLRNK